MDFLTTARIQGRTKKLKVAIASASVEQYTRRHLASNWGLGSWSFKPFTTTSIPGSMTTKKFKTTLLYVYLQLVLLLEPLRLLYWGWWWWCAESSTTKCCVFVASKYRHPCLSSLAYSFPMHARIDNIALAAIKPTPLLNILEILLMHLKNP